MSNISSSELVSKLLSEVGSSLIVPHVGLDATTKFSESRRNTDSEWRLDRTQLSGGSQSTLWNGA